MAISFGDNLSYVGKKSDFARQEYATIADMKAVRKTQMPEMYIAYCLEDRKVYLYNKSNENDPVLGYWREFGAGGGSSESIQKTTLPEASENELGKVYQYIGETTENYIKGYFYECAITGSAIETHTPQTVEVLKYDIEHYPSGTIQVNTGSTTEGLDCLLNYYIYDNTIYRAENETGDVSTDTAITTDEMVAGEQLEYDVDTPVYGWVRTNVQPSSGSSDSDIFHVETMPEVDWEDAGKVVQYTGSTDADYIHGYFYQCVKTGEEDDPDTGDTIEIFGWIPYIQPFSGIEIIPEPSELYANKIVQYIGESNETYVNGYFYKCTFHYGSHPGEEYYEWEQIDVQSSSGVKKVDSLPENPTEGDQVSYNGYLYVATKVPFCYCWKNSSKTLYTVDSPEFVTTSSVLYESSNNPPTSISNLSVFSGTITSVSENKASIVYNGSNGVYYTENENGFEIVWKKSEIDTGDVCKTFGYPNFDFKKSDITSPGSSVSGFFSYNQELYAVTNSGVSYWNGSQWSIIDSGTPFYPTFFKGHWFFSYSSGSSTDPGIKKLENNHTLSVVTTKSDASATFLASDDFNLYVSDGGGQKRSTNGITWSNQAVATYEGIAVVVNDDKKHFAGVFINARGPGNQFAVGFGSDGYVASWSSQTGTFSYPFKIDNKIYVTKNGVFGELWFYGKNTSSFEFKPIANAPAFTRLWKSGSYYFGIDSNNYFYGSSDFKNWTKVDRVSISGLINSPNCYGSIGDTVYFCTSDGTIYESTGNTYPIRDMQNYIEKQTISKDPFGRKMSLMPLSWKVTLDFVNDSLEEIYWKLYNMYYSQLEYPLAVNMISGKIESTLSSGEVAITTAQMYILNASYSAPTYQLKVITSDKTFFIRATLGADYDLSMYELSAGDDKPTKVTILYDYNHSS